MSQRGTWLQMLLHCGLSLVMFNIAICMWMEQVSCSDNSRSTYDYRCGEGGMEIKIEERTAVLQQRGMCHKIMSLCPVTHAEIWQSVLIYSSNNKSEAVGTHVTDWSCSLRSLYRFEEDNVEPLSHSISAVLNMCSNYTVKQPENTTNSSFLIKVGLVPCLSICSYKTDMG